MSRRRRLIQHFHLVLAIVLVGLLTLLFFGNTLRYCRWRMVPARGGYGKVLLVRRSSYQCYSVADEQAALRIRLRDLASSRVSYGYQRLHILLQREGWRVSHKRVYRLCRKEGLQAEEAEKACDSLQTYGAGSRCGT